MLEEAGDEEWLRPLALSAVAYLELETGRDLDARTKLLEAVEEDSRVTQRSLASKLGIALGLTNIYLKRLVRKGYIKCVNVQSNRISYLITPRGIAEKVRLTYEFMDYSLHLYGEVRQHLREVLQECAAAAQLRADEGQVAVRCEPEQELIPQRQQFKIRFFARSGWRVVVVS